jgi:hypothetical protein
MNTHNIKISINENQNIENQKVDIQEKINNFEKNIEELTTLKEKITYDLTEIKNEFERISNIPNYKLVNNNNSIKNEHVIRHDIYADVYVSGQLSELLNLQKKQLYRKSDIILNMINYIKKEKLIYFAGYFVVNIDLQKIFPQNGDYYGKRDKFFKLTNIYKLLEPHFTSKY